MVLLNWKHSSLFNSGDCIFFFLNRPCLPSTQTESPSKKWFLKKKKKKIKNCCSYLFHFLICYVAALHPTLNHYQGNNLTHLMSIMAFLSVFESKVSGNLVMSLFLGVLPYTLPPINSSLSTTRFWKILLPMMWYGTCRFVFRNWSSESIFFERSPSKSWI